MKKILYGIFLINLLFLPAMAAEKETMYKPIKESLSQLLESPMIIFSVIREKDNSLTFTLATVVDEGNFRQYFYLCKVKTMLKKATSECFKIGKTIHN